MKATFSDSCYTCYLTRISDYFETASAVSICDARESGQAKALQWTESCRSSCPKTGNQNSYFYSTPAPDPRGIVYMIGMNYLNSRDAPANLAQIQAAIAKNSTIATCNTWSTYLAVSSSCLGKFGFSNPKSMTGNFNALTSSWGFCKAPRATTTTTSDYYYE